MLYKSSIQSNSNKWKKRLINLSHKLHRSNNHWNASFSSATAMAAATEKFIRHSTPMSSEILIHSEDLTASQFANLTGIKTSYTTTYEEEDSDEEDEDDDDSRDYYTSSLSSCHRQKSTQSMRIWDSHFWRDTKLPSSASMKDLTSTTTTTTTTTSTDEKIILTSQPLARHTSEPGGKRVPSMIQKGRFKIVWGGDDNEPITHPVPQCVEWKRKRTGSASTAIL